MENRTEFSGYVMQPLFYINALHTLIALYSLIALIIYEMKTLPKNWDVYIKDGSLTSKGMRLLPEIVCLASNVFLFALFFYFWIPDEILIASDFDSCQTSFFTQLVLMTASFTSLYLVMWIRLRYFYIHPLTRHLTSSCTRILCVASVCILLLGFCVIIIGTSASVSLRRRGNTCVIVSGKLMVDVATSMLAWHFPGFHIVVSGLFAYPIYKKRKYQETASIGNKDFFSVLRKLFVVAFVLILVDGSRTALQIVFRNNRLARRTSLEASFLIRLVITICSFSDWKARLCPWRKSTQISAMDNSFQTREPSSSIPPSA
ncbi:uncharacterized protein LOC143459500 [Clavelina lepadiformis]|uniref:Uncharacterized protein n=1 Tax=Clavelina lepadiformis TaxID=159417 RepID=A0ABP0FPF1_CLALP